MEKLPLTLAYVVVRTPVVGSVVVRFATLLRAYEAFKTAKTDCWRSALKSLKCIMTDCVKVGFSSGLPTVMWSGLLTSATGWSALKDASEVRAR